MSCTVEFLIMHTVDPQIFVTPESVAVVIMRHRSRAIVEFCQFLVQMASVDILYNMMFLDKGGDKDATRSVQAPAACSA